MELRRRKGRERRLSSLVRQRSFIDHVSRLIAVPNLAYLQSQDKESIQLAPTSLFILDPAKKEA